LARQNLVEYFGVGRRASPLLTAAKAFGAQTKIVGQFREMKTSKNIFIYILTNLHISFIGGNCSDLLPFCARLSGYCSFMTGPLERGLALESYSELKELQSRFEQFGQGNPTKGAGSGEQQLSLPAGCESEKWGRQKGGRRVTIFPFFNNDSIEQIIHFISFRAAE
jgi:hypothetical protein